MFRRLDIVKELIKSKSDVNVAASDGTTTLLAVNVTRNTDGIK